MMKLTLLAALLALAGTAQAQNNCPCNGGAGTLLTDATSPTLGATLAGKMACAALGNERWQAWHNGGPTSGALVDYKRGPSDPVDPSAQMGTYQIPGVPRDAKVRTLATGDRVIYNYGSGGTYSYAVCRVSGNVHALCGAAFGGRDITNVVVGGSGSLQSCDTVLRDAGMRTQPKSR